MISFKKQIQYSQFWLIKECSKIGVDLDYTVKSIEKIENLIVTSFNDGHPNPKGFFAKEIDYKLFAISSYIGEVVIKNTKGSKWILNIKDRNALINAKVVSANGTEMYPAHRVLNRIQNGEEDNLYHYTAIAVKEYMSFEGEIPDGFFEEEPESKPWWKFW